MAFRTASGWQWLSPLILSIVMGMALGNVIRLPASSSHGIAFAMRRLLRAGIVLLGLQVTLGQILSLGIGGLAAVTVTLTVTFVAIRLAGRAMGVDPALTDLIAAGTSVCGASAVIAANTVARGRDEQVAYAVACVTIFGSVSMLLFPLIAGVLPLDATGYGVWTGATIHEVAQVVAAAFQGGDVAGQSGTIAKLTRVVLLAPLVMTMAIAARRAAGGGSAASAPTPWFVLGFIAMVLFNSGFDIPAEAQAVTGLLTTFLLSTGLAAMGLHTNLARLKAQGVRPLALGAFGWLFISVFGLAMVKLTGF
ncbi:putative integral membrane protein (TIGR00698 family) [Pseudorhizobium tarimense]|uniref:Integral membrane protein (TIGR00698 family) n=2 Tax=Pseudorhizobium tarimense TaxID=1079109 RepID=A0ABV2H7M0_9HYPH|nr:putative sulfate exporter family transporter [Pseudorhizobium tarimense]